MVNKSGEKSSLSLCWDVVRPNSSVDNSRAVMYNINVIKRKKGIKKMRTTKAIRDYIKDYVQNAYKPKIEECRGDYDDRRSAALKAIYEYEGEVNQHIREIIQNYNLSFEDTETFCSFDISDIGLHDIIKIDRAVKEIRDEQDKKIQKILLAIDFGEIKNRKELDDILKRIMW